MPVALRSLCGPMVHVPPLLILQTMQAVNWRLTDIAKASHEDNARVASFSVIPPHSQECPSVAAVHASPDLPQLTSRSVLFNYFPDNFRATVFFSVVQQTQRERLYRAVKFHKHHSEH